jgi:hypothetical protein
VIRRILVKRWLHWSTPFAEDAIPVQAIDAVREGQRLGGRGS